MGSGGRTRQRAATPGGRSGFSFGIRDIGGGQIRSLSSREVQIGVQPDLIALDKAKESDPSVFRELL